MRKEVIIIFLIILFIIILIDSKKNKYQHNELKKILGEIPKKTHERINIRNNCLINKKNPIKNADGFEWTDKFYGKIKKNKDTLYFNVKYMDKIHKESLINVYNFINAQIKYVINNDNVTFINILDGEGAYYANDKFEYILNKQKYIDNKIFVGNMDDFRIWYSRIKKHD
uniref:Uncharacterized protein n=1 Tax=viral metagenome TaxID=1070528 RepID=A0A6C0H6X5_9ZZZZ